MRDDKFVICLLEIREESYMPRKKYRIGLVDADLLCNGTRHPNLALLKIAMMLLNMKKHSVPH